MKELQLQLKPQYSIIAHSRDTVELRSGVWNAESFTLHDESGNGELYSILKCLTVAITPIQIAEKTTIALENVIDVISQCQQAGFISSGSTTAFDYYLSSAASSLHQTVNPKNARELRPVLLIGDGDLTSEIQRLLNHYFQGSECSIATSDDPLIQFLKQRTHEWMYDTLAFQDVVERFRTWAGKMVIFASSRIDPILGYKLNRVFHALNITWLHAAIDGPFLLIGPLMLGQEGPCFECYETRVSMNLRNLASYQRYKQAIIEQKLHNEHEHPIDPVLRGLMASHIAMEFLNYTLTGQAFTLRKVFAIFLPTMEMSYNEVLAVPNCLTCGSQRHRDNRDQHFDLASLLENT